MSRGWLLTWKEQTLPVNRCFGLILGRLNIFSRSTSYFRSRPIVKCWRRPRSRLYELLVCVLRRAEEKGIKFSPKKTIVSDQILEPLHFLSGSFKGSQSRWPTADPEAFAIVESIEKFRHLLINPKGFKLFTDHRSLCYIIDPWSVKKLNVRARLDRWALKL